MVIDLVVDFLFHTVCGWLGAKLLYVLTVGRLDLDPFDSDLASWAGVATLMSVAGAIGWMFA